MSAETGFRRRLRGAFRNALVWGISWGVFGTATFTALHVMGFLPGTFWADAILIGARFGFVGTVTGAAFSLLVSVLYHGKRLSDINWIRFGVFGGVATALFVPMFLQTMNVLGGNGPIPWRFVLDDSLLGVFGAVAAAGSLKLAQLADRWFPETSEHEFPSEAVKRLIARNLSDPVVPPGYGRVPDNAVSGTRLPL